MSSASGPPKPSTNGPTFLMCPPTLYDVNYVINPWMVGNVNRSSRQCATEQWTLLHGALGKIAEPDERIDRIAFRVDKEVARDDDIQRWRGV